MLEVMEAACARLRDYLTERAENGFLLPPPLPYVLYPYPGEPEEPEE